MFLDEMLKARTEAGLSQTEVAVRIGTTQSAVARLESSGGWPFPFHCHAAALRLDARLQAPVRLVAAGSNYPLNADARKIRARR